MALVITDPRGPGLHWAAGFLEGEGSFVWGGRPDKLQMRVSAGQVQKEPLERLQAMFGGSLGLQKQPKNPNARRQWFWQLGGKGAAGVAMTLWTLMSPRRRQQIEDALAGWKSRPARRPKGHSKRYGDGQWH